MQVNADGYTPRLWESIIYDKHLLTNNYALQGSSFYKEKSMHQLSDIENILSWINTPVNHTEDFKSSLSPINLLKYIDSLILDRKK